MLKSSWLCFLYMQYNIKWILALVKFEIYNEDGDSNGSWDQGKEEYDEVHKQ